MSERNERCVADLSTGPVFYRDSGGDGVAVVLLHAASGNSLMWEHQIPALTDAGYRVLAIDYRGVNGKPGAYDWSDQIDALVAHLDIERFHLLGTAAGGGAAFQYVLAYPAKVRSLIVANSHGNVTDKDYVEMGKRIRPSPQFDDLPLDFRELGPSYRAAHPDGVARWLALSATQARRGHRFRQSARRIGCASACRQICTELRKNGDVGETRSAASPDIVDHGRCRSVHAAVRIAHVSGAHEQRRMGHHSGDRAFVLLGES